jgi:hypothetical protein
LVDQRIFGLVEQLIDDDRRAFIGQSHIKSI